jgi:ABC-2 type transport system ATP-binding protein
MTHAIEVRGLGHSFKGSAALCGASFTVPAATIHGFVGPNGAGKTTTLKAIATLLTPDRGSVEVFGEDCVRHPGAVRRRLGFMPDHFSTYRQMTVREYLDFFAAAYGQKHAERDRTIGDVLALVDMAARADDFIRGLSRGMQQRVGLARVLIHDPDLLLLDEPASGLDPRARIELMDILRELKRMGKTVFISSHILSELGDLCDGVTILDRGTVKYSGPVADLLKTTGDDGGRSVVLTVTQPAGLAERLAAVPGVTACAIDPDNANRFRLALAAGASTAPLLAAAAEAGVEDFRAELRRLDEAFMSLTTAGVRS